MSDAPRFSVIITTHNRPRLLRACVQSVLAQPAPPGGVEIVVVDDGSHPATRRALGPWIDAGRIAYLWQRQTGWGRARRAGVARSRGAILVFLDDDCQAPPGWLAAYAARYAAQPDLDGVGGGLRPGPRLNVAGRKQYAGHLAYFNARNAPLGLTVEHAGRAWFTFGGNRSFRRAVWLAAHESAGAADAWSWYGDDTQIDLWLRARERVIWYDPAAWVWHHYYLSLAQRVRVAYRYGRSARRYRAALAAVPGDAGAPPPDAVPPLLPGATRAGWAWYALSQPLVVLARWLGCWHSD